MREILPVEQRFERSEFEFLSDEEKFRKIYENNFWGNSESISGDGSTVSNTENLRNTILPEVLNRLDIKSFLDAPCGDFNWMSSIDFGETRYIGMDIVEPLIQENRVKYPNVDFRVGDLSKSPLPSVDMIWCRDCLVHLNYETIFEVIRNIRKSDIYYLMTTHFTNRESNRDIISGNWRPLNFELEPFHWPTPYVVFNEGCREGNGSFGDKSMALWIVDMLP